MKKKEFPLLHHYWLRSCWVSQMWQNSPLPDLYSSILLAEHSGWIRLSDGSYTIDWEAPEIQEKIKHTIDFLTKGCSCKTVAKQVASPTGVAVEGNQATVVQDVNARDV